MKIYKEEDTRQALVSQTGKSVDQWKYEWLRKLGANDTMNPAPKDEEDFRDRLGNAIALYIGSSKAYVNNVETNIDTSNTEVAPLIKDGRTLVPVRFISENMGAEVKWNSETYTVAINSSNSRTARLTLNNNIIAIDGTNVELEVPAQIINGRMYVPLRVLVERILGKKIFYSDGLIVISDRENIFDADLEAPKVEQVKKLFK